MQCIQRVMTLKLWFMIKKMKLLKNFLNHFFKGPLHERISMKNLWRISQKFYTILNKFKSVWVCPKLWRTLNNRMTLKVIEIWNLNRFKGTYKHKKIKYQKQRKRERVFYEYSWWKKLDEFTRLLSWNAKRIFVSTNATRKNTTRKPVSNDR